MKKRIITDEEIIDPISKGIDKIANIVKRTLGPGGRVVMIERVGQSLDGSPLGPKLTKDGVSVALECHDPDKSIDVVIQTVKNICKKTNSDAGDGPQPLYSKVLTPKGFVKMSDISVGDIINGTNGSYQKVLGVFPKGKRNIVKITFQNGEVVECCEDHLWTLSSGKTLTTREMLKKGVKTESGRYNFYIKSSPVEFYQNDSEMPIDPYLVGVLLGDGSLSGKGRSNIEISIGFSKSDILNKINLPEGFTLNVSKVESKNYYRCRVVGQDPKGRDFKRLVESIGLLGSLSTDKFIPKSYLYSSESSRRELLQGLIDTDGHVNKRGLFEFSTVSGELYSDFLTLVRSLSIPTNSRIHTRDNDLGSYSDNPIFKVTELKGYKEGLKITNIEKTNKVTEMQCIKVSNPDHLYITDDFIPTHNTTTAIVLGQALVKATQKYQFENPDENPQLIKESIEKVARDIIDKLKGEAHIVKDMSKIKEVATISANGDEEIGTIIANAFSHVGAEGVVTVDEGYSSKLTLDKVNGYQFNRGALARDAFFNSKNMTKFETDVDTAVVIFDGKLQGYTNLVPILETIAQVDPNTGKPSIEVPPILIIANDFSPDVLQYLIIQKQEIGLNVCCVKGPHTTFIRTGYYDDLAAYTGGTRFGNGNKSLIEVESEDIGYAERVVVDRYKTTIYDGFGSEEAILERVELLNEHKLNAESPYDAQLISDRIAALTNGVAKIGIGGSTELEIKEKYDRVEDALNAARAALQEGVLPGGGCSLLRKSLYLNKIVENKIIKEKEAGHYILEEALRAPFIQILRNIGLNIKDINSVMDKVLNSKGLEVYNARTKTLVDPFESGILDPVKVTRSALENAVSISGLLTTAGGAIIFEKD